MAAVSNPPLLSLRTCYLHSPMYTRGWAAHQWLFQISMKLPLAKIELGPIYDRLLDYRPSLSTFQRVFLLKNDSRVFSTDIEF